MSTYPEHEKLRAVKDRSQTIGEFVEWLEDQGTVHCRLGYRDHYYGFRLARGQ